MSVLSSAEALRPKPCGVPTPSGQQVPESITSSTHCRVSPSVGGRGGSRDNTARIVQYEHHRMALNGVNCTIHKFERFHVQPL